MAMPPPPPPEHRPRLPLRAAEVPVHGFHGLHHPKHPRHLPPPVGVAARLQRDAHPTLAFHYLPWAVDRPGHRSTQQQSDVSMPPCSPMYTLPQRGSAFHRVIPSSSENLRCLPPSAALPHEEKVPHAEPKRELSDKNSAVFSEPGNDSRRLSNKILSNSAKDNGASASPDSPVLPASPDNELPFKKRKPRFDDADMEFLVSETSSDRYYRDEEALCCPQDNSGCNFPAFDLKQCLCAQLRNLDGALSLSGKFNTWRNMQVQLWLWKTLKDSNKGFSATAICRTVQSFDEDGLVLSTYTKSDWQKKLVGCDVPYEFVWDCVSERLKDEPFRPHNFSTSAPREMVNPSNQNKYHPMVEMIMTTEAGSTTSPRRGTKPQRRRRDKCVGQLWEFVFDLLNKGATNVVCWEDKEKRLFRIVNTEEIARLWGKHKGNSNMTYANMSRTMRYYREGNGAFVRHERKRVYGFGPKADFDRLLAKSARKT